MSKSNVPFNKSSAENTMANSSLSGRQIFSISAKDVGNRYVTAKALGKTIASVIRQDLGALEFLLENYEVALAGKNSTVRVKCMEIIKLLSTSQLCRSEQNISSGDLVAYLVTLRRNDLVDALDTEPIHSLVQCMWIVNRARTMAAGIIK